MCWKGHAVYDCSSEFRLFWLTQKLAEDAPGASNRDPALNEHPLVPVTWYAADAQGLEATYVSPQMQYTRDGLHFLHREPTPPLDLTCAVHRSRGSTFIAKLPASSSTPLQPRP